MKEEKSIIDIQIELIDKQIAYRERQAKRMDEQIETFNRTERIMTPVLLASAFIAIMLAISFLIYLLFNI